MVDQDSLITLILCAIEVENMNYQRYLRNNRYTDNSLRMHDHSVVLSTYQSILTDIKSLF